MRYRISRAAICGEPPPNARSKERYALSEEEWYAQGGEMELQATCVSLRKEHTDKLRHLPPYMLKQCSSRLATELQEKEMGQKQRHGPATRVDVYDKYVGDIIGVLFDHWWLGEERPLDREAINITINSVRMVLAVRPQVCSITKDRLTLRMINLMCLLTQSDPKASLLLKRNFGLLRNPAIDHLLCQQRFCGWRAAKSEMTPEDRATLTGIEATEIYAGKLVASVAHEGMDLKWAGFTKLETIAGQMYKDGHWLLAKNDVQKCLELKAVSQKPLSQQLLILRHFSGGLASKYSENPIHRNLYRLVRSIPDIAALRFCDSQVPICTIARQAEFDKEEARSPKRWADFFLGSLPDQQFTVESRQTRLRSGALCGRPQLPDVVITRKILAGIVARPVYKHNTPRQALYKGRDYYELVHADDIETNDEWRFYSNEKPQYGSEASSSPTSPHGSEDDWDDDGSYKISMRDATINIYLEFSKEAGRKSDPMFLPTLLDIAVLRTLSECSKQFSDDSHFSFTTDLEELCLFDTPTLLDIMEDPLRSFPKPCFAMLADPVLRARGGQQYSSCGVRLWLTDDYFQINGITEERFKKYIRTQCAYQASCKRDAVFIARVEALAHQREVGWSAVGYDGDQDWDFQHHIYSATREVLIYDVLAEVRRGLPCEHPVDIDPANPPAMEHQETPADIEHALDLLRNEIEDMEKPRKFFRPGVNFFPKWHTSPYPKVTQKHLERICDINLSSVQKAKNYTLLRALFCRRNALVKLKDVMSLYTTTVDVVLAKSMSLQSQAAERAVRGELVLTGRELFQAAHEVGAEADIDIPAYNDDAEVGSQCNAGILCNGHCDHCITKDSKAGPLLSVYEGQCPDRAVYSMFIQESEFMKDVLAFEWEAISDEMRKTFRRRYHFRTSFHGGPQERHADNINSRMRSWFQEGAASRPGDHDPILWLQWETAAAKLCGLFHTWYNRFDHTMYPQLFFKLVDLMRIVFKTRPSTVILVEDRFGLRLATWIAVFLGSDEDLLLAAFSDMEKGILEYLKGAMCGLTKHIRGKRQQLDLVPTWLVETMVQTVTGWFLAVAGMEATELIGNADMWSRSPYLDHFPPLKNLDLTKRPSAISRTGLGIVTPTGQLTMRSMLKTIAQNDNAKLKRRPRERILLYYPWVKVKVMSILEPAAKHTVKEWTNLLITNAHQCTGFATLLQIDDKRKGVFQRELLTRLHEKKWCTSNNKVEAKDIVGVMEANMKTFEDIAPMEKLARISELKLRYLDQDFTYSRIQGRVSEERPVVNPRESITASVWGEHNLSHLAHEGHTDASLYGALLVATENKKGFFDDDGFMKAAVECSDARQAWELIRDELSNSMMMNEPPGSRAPWSLKCNGESVVKTHDTLRAKDVCNDAFAYAETLLREVDSVKPLIELSDEQAAADEAALAAGFDTAFQEYQKGTQSADQCWNRLLELLEFDQTEWELSLDYRRGVLYFLQNGKSPPEHLAALVADHHSMLS